MPRKESRNVLHCEALHACREELRLALQPVAGEARAGEDFILSTDEMVFLPGETAKSFTVEG